MQPLSDPDSIYNINPIFMSCSLQCIKSESEKVIILDKIMQNCILPVNSINHLSQFLEISCLALCFKCLPEKKNLKNSKKLEVKEVAKENKFKGTLHCVMRSIHDSTPFIMWKVLGYTQGGVASGFTSCRVGRDYINFRKDNIIVLAYF